MDKRRELTPPGFGPTRLGARSHGSNGEGQLLPQGNQSGREDHWAHPGGGQFLLEVGGHRDDPRCPFAVPDRPPPPTSSSSCLRLSLQPRGSGRPHSPRQGGEKDEERIGGGWMGEQLAEGPTFRQRGRVECSESKSGCRGERREDNRSKGEQEEREGQKRQERKEVQERQERKRGQEREEAEEGKEGKRIRGGDHHIQRFRGTGRNPSSASKPQGPTDVVWRDRDGSQREDQEKGESTCQAVCEAESGEGISIFDRERIWRQYLKWSGDGAGGALRRVQPNQDSSRSISWSTFSRCQPSHERGLSAGDRYGPELPEVVTGGCELLPAATLEKGLRADRSGAAHFEHGLGPPGSWVPCQSGGRSHPTGEIHRARAFGCSLDSESKTGGVATGTCHVDITSGSKQSPGRGLQRKPYKMDHVIPRRSSSSPRTRRKRQECKGLREARKQRPKRERTRRKGRWKEEGPKQRRQLGEGLMRGQQDEVREEKSQGAGARAPEVGRQKEGSERKDLEADTLAGARAPGKEKTEGSGARAPVLGEDSKKGQTFSLEGLEQQDTSEAMRGGSAVAPHSKEESSASLRGDQSNYDQKMQSMHEAGATAPDVNSGGQIPAALELTDSISTEKPLVMIGTRELQPREKEGFVSTLVGKSLGSCGAYLLQKLLEVLPLRSKTTGTREKRSLFPLPTSRRVFTEVDGCLDEMMITWMVCVCVSLNSMWGDVLFSDDDPNLSQRRSIELLVQHVKRFCKMEAYVEQYDWTEFLKTKSVDYKGDEVRVAKSFTWRNIGPALPKEIGKVQLTEICTLGCKHYVDNFDLYLKPESEWIHTRAPRVMVEDCEWGSVCEGLISAGVCGILEEHEVHHVSGVPLLNGLFGVTKDEFTPDGTEIFRLIMNLIPLNNICQPLGGDVATLPAWSTMSPFFLQPNERLLVSSEDVKCFFYVLSVPPGWSKYLAFNKTVPEAVLPPHLRGQGRRFYLASLVLPMGFLNSVSLAQHVHRNLAQFSAERLSGDQSSQGAPEHELRKDRAFPATNPLWRIYLDNYDLLEKVEAMDLCNVEGTTAPGALALRHEYEHWGVPRNIKKSVQRSTKCEVQGATVDGINGVAYPRESKLVKYFTLAMGLVEQDRASQKQWQVVCGGLVYFSMFRRPLLGSLNAVWKHIESFNTSGTQRGRVSPMDCCLEVLRFLGCLPLAALDFRLDVHPQVTCSDASMSGGGVCASVGATALGSLVSQGSLRGELAERRGELAVVAIGLFDGLGALRVALDVLGIPVLGYLSVEKNPAARRVVESHFPDVICVEDVTSVTKEHLQDLARRFSQAAAVILGAGPPCQGVSGLNSDRKGALKDERSCLFAEVPRIRDECKQAFAWCPVYTLMESVASMDAKDRDIMTAAIGPAPVLCDAGDLTWCNRPRLYWCDWELVEQEGFSVTSGAKGQPSRLTLMGTQDIRQVVKAGWIKVTPEIPFPTFTTSRPRSSPGRRPAGIHQCTDQAPFSTISVLSEALFGEPSKWS